MTEARIGNLSGTAHRVTEGRLHTIQLDTIKSEAWGELIQFLGLTAEDANAHFEHGEYASLELTINHRLEVVSGKVLKR